MSSSWVRINGEGGGDKAPDSMDGISDPKKAGQGIAIEKEKINCFGSEGKQRKYGEGITRSLLKEGGDVELYVDG